MRYLGIVKDHRHAAELGSIYGESLRYRPRPGELFGIGFRTSYEALMSRVEEMFGSKHPPFTVEVYAIDMR